MKRFYLIIGLILFTTSVLFSGQTQVTSKFAIVDAGQGWQNSGIKLKKGQTYQIYAKGAWVSGFGIENFGPEGFVGSGTITDNTLIGFIAESKPKRLSYKSFTREIVCGIILLRRGGFFKAASDGTLWLSMGEWSGCKDCMGKVEVLIILYK